MVPVADMEQGASTAIPKIRALAVIAAPRPMAPGAATRQNVFTFTVQEVSAFIADPWRLDQGAA
jgi:hypothetical protein